MKKIFLIMSVLLIFLMGCGQGKKETTVFTVLNGAEPPTLDPALSEDNVSHNILLGLFEGLLVYNPQTNNGAPGVAESWTVSNEGKTYTFTLRTNAKWSDGTPITAKTVVDSWLRTLNPETASPYAWMMGMVVQGANEYNSGEAGADAVQIKAIDDHTFQMDMVGPIPYVESMLPHTIFGIVPVHTIEKFGDKWTLPENMVCNGPFVLKEWEPQDHVTVVKSKTYWDAENVKLDEIVYIPSDDNNTRLNMYKNGEADWMFQGMPLDQIDVLKQRPDYQVIPQLATYFYEFNHTKPPFNDVRIRQALSMAIDRQTLVDKVTRGGQIATNEVTPPMPGYVPPEGNGYNLEKAKELLAQAGYPDGKGFPDSTILYNTSEAHKIIAEFIQQQWEQKLGISISIENAEWKTVLARGKEQDFNILRMGWIGDYQDPNTFLELFQTDAGQNYGKYSNPEFDALIRQAATMPGGTERFNVLKKAEQILIAQDQGIAPVYYYVNQDLIDLTKWGGWYTTIMGWHPPKYIYKK
ncbi:MAG: peptide ABC transporter substrate-binding protein [Spirochaetales bacterium]|nr:peptide ABC transporter substrate-binding protein [Spirochaetales bacterium]